MFNFKIGDIIYGRRNSDAIHPIIFLGEKDSIYFYGVMITHSTSNKNVTMKPEHFIELDDNNDKFEFQFDNTSIVNNLLLKRTEWQPFRKVGQLNQKGINFVENAIYNSSPLTWDEYLLLT